MNANFPHEAPRENSGNRCAADLSIALIAPNETRRAAAAESAWDICEFATYLANASDLAKLDQMQYDVIMVDIEVDTERALKLVEKLSSESRNWVLVYSSDRSPEKLTRCMRAGARDFLAFPFEPAAVAEALKRSALPRTATCTRIAPEPRKATTIRDSMWQHIFNDGPITRTQVRS